MTAIHCSEIFKLSVSGLLNKKAEDGGGLFEEMKGIYYVNTFISLDCTVFLFSYLHIFSLNLIKM